MYNLIILDNGHGKNTKGKESPIWEDGSQLFEWEFNRDIVNKIYNLCKQSGIACKVLVPEKYDISLEERCKRANKLYGKDIKPILISIHANAGGGTGWEVFTSKGKTKSDEVATILFEEFSKEFPEFRMRSDKSDGDVDKESQFYILSKTKCPAVLTENFFMDTEKDCKLIMSNEGRDRIAKAHFKAIKRIYGG